MHSSLQKTVASSLAASLVFGSGLAQAVRVRAGSLITVTITASLDDYGDPAEGESILITSNGLNGGYSHMIPVFDGVQVITFTATVDNESVSMQIIGADGDEHASIKVGADFDPDLNGGDQCGAGAMVADPINAFTGNQFQKVTDIQQLARRSFSFERYFNSVTPWPYVPHLNVAGPIGAQGNYHLGSLWTHTYNRFITPYGVNSFKVHHADGGAAIYQPIDQGNLDAGYASLQEPRGRLFGSPNFGAYGTIVYVSPDNVIEEYKNGYVQYPYTLSRITYPDGFSQSIVGDTDGVTGDYGSRALSFSYVSLDPGDAAAHGMKRYLKSVRDAAGHAWIYDYEYDASLDVFQNKYRLSKTTFVDSYLPAYDTLTPAGPAITYLYGEQGLQATEFNALPKLLTGIVDENGARYASFYYDEKGQNYRVEHPGGAGRAVLSWYSDGSSIVSDAYGDYTKNVAGVNGVAKSAGVSQPAGSGCAAASSAVAYDAAGNVASRDDFNGHRSCYAYDAQRMEVARIEGLPATAVCASVLAGGIPAGARKISSAWHPDWTFKARQAEPKKITTWVYNGQPDPTNGGAVTNCAAGAIALPSGAFPGVLCKQVEQATLDADGSQGLAAASDNSVPSKVFSYTYTTRGQVQTAIDPLGNTTRYFYYSDSTATHSFGDLQAIQNAAGHLTQYTGYDPVGNILQSVGPSGAKTDNTYFPRGWLKSTSLTPAGGGQARVTSYTYDGVGQPKTVTLPGGSTVQLNYDEARRLVGMADGAGNTVTYTLDELGNRIGEQSKDTAGVLSRNVTRVYDALNRLQSVTGAAR
jgi:YD repeat-containing protein